MLLREQIERFEGRRILAAVGSAKIDLSRLTGRRVNAVRSWGKHLLIELPTVAVRVHLLMFGSFAIDFRKDRAPRLRLEFSTGEVSFYSCSVQLLDGPLADVYDWSADIMSPQWKPAAPLRKLRQMPDSLICDALLDQNVFAGVGNIIKNEVLYRTRIHPLSTVGAIPSPRLRGLVAEARKYSFDFLKWKRAFVLRQHWQVHRKVNCPTCRRKLRREHLGRTARRTFYCAHCQQRFLERTTCSGSGGSGHRTKKKTPA